MDWPRKGVTGYQFTFQQPMPKLIKFLNSVGRLKLYDAQKQTYNIVTEILL